MFSFDTALDRAHATIDAGALAEAYGFIIAGECRPALEVGGDFYAVLPGDAGRLKVLIGDACGKGAPAARIAARVESTVRELARSVQGAAVLLSALNQRLARLLADDVFVTLACLELSTRDGTLTFANAGHVPPLLRRADSQALESLGAPAGPPLGMVRSFRYRARSVALQPGDVIVLVTDGALEALNDDPVGSRLARLVGTGRADADSIAERVISEIGHTSAAEHPDDLTVLCLSQPVTHSPSGIHRAPAAFVH
jgi:sigma-B regulation protein RsbU (phosphoserine phosphatase)